MENNTRKNKIQFICAVIITGLANLLLGVMLIYCYSTLLDFIMCAFVLIATPLAIRFMIKEYGKEYTLYMLKQIGMILVTILGVAGLFKIYSVLVYKILNSLKLDIQSEADLTALGVIPVIVALFIGIVYKTWMDKFESKHKDLLDKVQKQCKDKKALIK